MDIFVNLFVLWIVNTFFSEKKTRERKQGDPVTVTNLLIADSLIHNDTGSPESCDNSDNGDPFLNEEYNNGPDW